MIKKSIIPFFLFFAIALASIAGSKDKKITLNTTASTLKWHAKKVTGEHYGKVPFVNGAFIVNGTTLKGGDFEINVDGLTVEDIKDERGNSRLTAHLKNNDFFATDQHPKAKFVITSAKKTKADSYDIQGDLTIKGITNKISFPATVKVDKSGVKASAVMKVDRTKYDIKYRSGNFFQNLGDKAIEDEFTMTVDLVANN